MQYSLNRNTTFSIVKNLNSSNSPFIMIVQTRFQTRKAGIILLGQYSSAKKAIWDFIL